MKIVRIFSGQVYQMGDELNLTQDISEFTWLLFDGVYYGYAFTQILLQYQSNYCIRVVNLKDNCQDTVNDSSSDIIRNYVSFLEMTMHRDSTTKLRINSLSHLMMNKENTQFPILQPDMDYPIAEGSIRFYIRGIYGITL